jgi:uncharacterized RDD family membrane protein YckC
MRPFRLAPQRFGPRSPGETQLTESDNPGPEPSAAAADPYATPAHGSAPGSASAQPGQWAPAYAQPAGGLQLPEGVQLASAGRRIGAWFLAIPLAIVTLGIGYIIWGAVVWGRGQTPALQVLGMRCWRPDSRSVPGFWRMALREIIGRFVESILSIITLLISLILFLTRDDRQSIHDLVAGTIVLHDPHNLLRS